MSDGVMPTATNDPHPELRCRCVFRLDDDGSGFGASNYYDRCSERATAEDGFCDHCRQDEDTCEADTHAKSAEWDSRWSHWTYLGCCRNVPDRVYGRRELVDPCEPCITHRQTVPFGEVEGS